MKISSVVSQRSQVMAGVVRDVANMGKYGCKAVQHTGGLFGKGIGYAMKVAGMSLKLLTQGGIFVPMNVIGKSFTGIGKGLTRLSGRVLKS